MRLGLLLLSLAPSSACDVVWGLSGEPPACDLGDGAFDGATMTDLEMMIDDYSVAVESNRVIGARDGAAFELELDFGGQPAPISLGAEGFVQANFGLAPEGDLLFFSNQSEPPDLKIATRTEDGWIVSTGAVPKGIRAGTPTALVFGARRVLVKVGQEGIVFEEGVVVRDVQEYVEDGKSWRAVGSRQALPGFFAPNLTPNGMTAVFVEHDEQETSQVVIARRDSLSDSFEGHTVIFRAEPGLGIRTAQLRGGDTLDKGCGTLFVDVGGQLRRYER